MDKVIDQNTIDEIKHRAKAYMHKHSRIYCPALRWEVHLNSWWFSHIEWKRKNVKRELKEIYMRYLCFFHTDWILKNSHTYQEYKEVTEEIQYKVRKKRMKKLEVIEYYWFVAIVNNNKNRVKIVVSKNQYWKLEFVSVIPKWKSEEYGWVKINWLFFDENEDD